MPEKNHLPEILFEDYYLLAVNKPAGLMTENDSYGNPSVEEWVKRHLQEQHPKRKKIFTGIPHRLDRPVSGILILAKTKTALADLNVQFSNGTIKKKYTALVDAAPEQKQATLNHFHKKDLLNKRALISNKPKDGFTKCSLSYLIEKINENNFFSLNIDLHTGRYHQIRAQLAFIGSPVVGDAKYGSQVKYHQDKICLHACEIKFIHPVSKAETIIKSDENF